MARRCEHRGDGIGVELALARVAQQLGLGCGSVECRAVGPVFAHRDVTVGGGEDPGCLLDFRSSGRRGGSRSRRGARGGRRRPGRSVRAPGTGRRRVRCSVREGGRAPTRRTTSSAGFSQIEFGTPTRPRSWASAARRTRVTCPVRGSRRQAAASASSATAAQCSRSHGVFRPVMAAIVAKPASMSSPWSQTGGEGSMASACSHMRDSSNASSISPRLATASSARRGSYGGAGALLEHRTGALGAGGGDEQRGVLGDVQEADRHRDLLFLDAR